MIRPARNSPRMAQDAKMRRQAVRDIRKRQKAVLKPQKAQKRHSAKYHAVPTVVDGIRFDSKKEARRYGELQLLLKAGEITRVELQPRFQLRAAGPEGEVVVGEYVADFAYLDTRSKTGKQQGVWNPLVVEDVKGYRTPLYKLKKRIAEACHGIVITEV